jgi:hypothetical protein
MGILVLGGTLQACDHPGCDGVAGQNPNAPRITNLEIVGNYPDDPWTLILAIDFVGASPSLIDGYGLFYVGASTDPLRLPLQQPFEQAALPGGAPSGRLGVLFPFNSGLVQDGDLLRLGVQLEDSSANSRRAARSNCYNMDLSFDVRPVQKTARLMRRVAAGLRRWLLL